MNREYVEACRSAGTEGIVLLKNEGNVLPLIPEDSVSVFGRSQLEYYKSGTGSGGAVNVEYTTNLIDGLKRYDFLKINEELLDIYKKWIERNPFDTGGGEWAGEPWHQEEMELNHELVQKARKSSNKAVMMIGRTAGEDQDNSAQEGSFYLTRTEQKNLELITAYFEQTVVLLNVPNIIDMQWLLKKYVHPICAVLYVWQGGAEGGNALADVLTGASVPGGKLPDTIAYRMEDYPSAKNFGSDIQNVYQEDIYIGYKYFETFCKERVLYPFGYGLSYTTFELSDMEMRYRDDEKKALSLEEVQKAKIRISLCVTNTGSRYSGKEVVQIYVKAPQGKLGKPKLQLAGYQKTKELKPGETERIEVQIPVSVLASYDDSGKSGHKSCYILEKGQYYFYAGTSVRNLQLSECLSVKDTVLFEQLSEALAPTVPFLRIRPGKLLPCGNYEILYEEVPVCTVSLEERIQKAIPKELVHTGRNIDLKAVLDGKESLSKFVAQLNEEELAILVRGEGMCSPKVTPGTASAFGGVSKKLSKYGIPAVCTADGPSGIRMDNGAKAMQLPIGTMLAATWNPQLVEELYEYLGQEMQENQIDVLLGPGVNIHRNPLNGRNFEYYSEDAYLTGSFAAAAVRGLKKSGVSGTIKHFAANNQEYARNRADSVVSERALREIYLKGFEMAVREGGAQAVMTSYNPLNGHWCASNYDLCTQILRNEWGFDGIVMTDWWAKMNDPVIGGTADMKNTAAMIRAQNDLYMVVTNGGAESNCFEDNTLEALREGKLTLAELQRTAMNICRFILSTPAVRRKPKDKEIEAESIVFSPVRFIPGEKEKQLEITTSGRYKFIVKLRSNLPELAQASCNILLNEVAVATIQSNGTDGSWKLLKLDDVYLNKGNYTMQLQENKTGLEIAWLDVTK